VVLPSRSPLLRPVLLRPVLLRPVLLSLLVPMLGALACATPASRRRPATPETVVDQESMRLEEGPPPDRRRAELLVDEGRTLAGGGDQAGALSRFDEARTEDESYGIAHLEWAVAAHYVGADPALVRAGFARAVLLLDENPRAYYERAAFEESAGDLQAASDGYARALALRPDHAAARQAYARVLVSRGEHKAALTQYALITKRAPKSLAAWLGLATAAEQTSDLKAAEAALRRVVKLHPRVPQHRRRLIAFYKRTAQQTKARREERRLDKVAPDKKRRMRTLKRSRR